MPESDGKEAQKSGQATLQSVLSECAGEDSPETSVIGQTSMASGDGGEEVQTGRGFFCHLGDKFGSRFLKLRKWFNEGENEGENDGSQNEENTLSEEDEKV